MLQIIRLSSTVPLQAVPAQRIVELNIRLRKDDEELPL
jgi:hypothetical protein